jgi:hypothetical protein
MSTITNVHNQTKCSTRTYNECAKTAWVCNKIADADGMFKLTKLTVKIMEFAEAALKGISQTAKNAFSSLNTCATVLESFEIFGRFQDWFEWCAEKANRWQKTVALVFLTAAQTLGFVSFIAAVKSIDLGKVLGSIGSIPVISVIWETLTLFGFGMAAWEEGLKLRTINSKLQSLNIKKELLDAAQKDKLDDSKKAELTRKYQASLETRFSKKDEILTKKMGDFAVLITNKIDTKEKCADLKQAVVNRIHKVDVKANKSIFMIAFAALRMLGASLAFAGMFTGAALLSATSLPMIGVSLVTAGLGMFRFIYSSYHSYK